MCMYVYVCVLGIVLGLCRAGVWRATGGPQEGDTQHEKGLGGSWEWSHSHSTATTQPQPQPQPLP